MLISVCGLRTTHQEHKKIRQPSSGGGIPWRLLFGRLLYRTSTFKAKAPYRLQRQVAGSVSRITPDAAAPYKPAETFCQKPQNGISGGKITTFAVSPLVSVMASFYRALEIFHSKKLRLRPAQLNLKPGQHV
jgi:hypothetical protein